MSTKMQTRDQLVADFEKKNPGKKGDPRAFNTYLLKTFGRVVGEYETDLQTADEAWKAEASEYEERIRKAASQITVRDNEIAQLGEDLKAARKEKGAGYFAEEDEVKA